MCHIHELEREELRAALREELDAERRPDEADAAGEEDDAPSENGDAPAAEPTVTAD